MGSTFFLFLLTEKKQQNQKKVSIFSVIWIKPRVDKAILVPTEQTSTTDPSESKAHTNATKLTHHFISSTKTCQRINIKRILFHLNLISRS